MAELYVEGQDWKSRADMACSHRETNGEKVYMASDHKECGARKWSSFDEYKNQSKNKITKWKHRLSLDAYSTD